MLTLQVLDSLLLSSATHLKSKGYWGCSQLVIDALWASEVLQSFWLGHRVLLLNPHFSFWYFSHISLHLSMAHLHLLFHFYMFQIWPLPLLFHSRYVWLCSPLLHKLILIVSWRSNREVSCPSSLPAPRWKFKCSEPKYRHYILVLSTMTPMQNCTHTFNITKLPHRPHDIASQAASQPNNVTGKHRTTRPTRSAPNTLQLRSQSSQTKKKGEKSGFTAFLRNKTARKLKPLSYFCTGSTPGENILNTGTSY